LDNPVFHRPVFRELATSDRLVALVAQIVGNGVRVFFSQVFFKPPERGGPKPLHQDNFYFGPDNDDAMVTAWIALDEATVENGCLYYGDGSNHGELLEHFAPEGEPFNLQIRRDAASAYAMTPAPVPRGGVSFHHGRTLHQSSANRSTKWRRAAAVHYLRNDACLLHPALPYDSDVVVQCRSVISNWAT
jgi:ectoine hydroxylase-related dioxygenase (phytanoyl-CoA dioxygenase family)